MSSESPFSTQEALRISEEQFRGAFECGPSGMSLVSPEGRLLKANAKFCAILGYTESELLQMSFHQFTHPDDLDADVGQANRLLAGEISSYQMKKRYISKQGKVVFVQIGVSLVRNSDGSPFFFVGQCQDITAQELAEAKLIQASKMASLGEMAAGIAHEINNPLLVVLCKTEDIIRRLESGEIAVAELRSDVEKIEVMADRISNIVRGLKLFSRSSEKEPMVRCSLSDIVSGTLELCRERFKFFGIELMLEFEPDLKLRCRPSQISQVLMNLLSNSFDAIGAGTHKWISLTGERAAADRIRVSITDSGGGIPTEIASRMMEPFFTTKQIGRGTGLGLSISRGIVEEHLGELFYDDSCGNTRFVLELPVGL